MRSVFAERFGGIFIFIVCLLGGNLAMSQADNLILSYTFDGHARDGSGNGNNGIVFGAVPGKDRFGNPGRALSFDGTSYVRMPSDKLKNPEYTFTCWVLIKKMPSIGDAATILSIGDDTKRHQCITLINSYGQAGVSGWNNGSAHEGTRMAHANSTGRLPELNRWYHIASVCTATRVTLYINGKEAGRRSFPSLIPFYGDPTKGVVGIRCNLTQGFTGSIDDVRIYQTGLTAARIKHIYDTESVTSSYATR